MGTSFILSRHYTDKTKAVTSLPAVSVIIIINNFSDFTICIYASRINVTTLPYIPVQIRSLMLISSHSKLNKKNRLRRHYAAESVYRIFKCRLLLNYNFLNFTVVVTDDVNALLTAVSIDTLTIDSVSVLNILEFVSLNAFE